MLFALPETSAANILLRRARRLRLATGKKHMKSQSEIDQASMTSSALAFDALIKPWQINMLDPAVVGTFKPTPHYPFTNRKSTRHLQQSTLPLYTAYSTLSSKLSP